MEQLIPDIHTARIQWNTITHKCTGIVYVEFGSVDMVEQYKAKLDGMTFQHKTLTAKTGKFLPESIGMIAKHLYYMDFITRHMLAKSQNGSHRLPLLSSLRTTKSGIDNVPLWRISLSPPRRMLCLHSILDKVVQSVGDDLI
ncbi:hypothetical protein CLF_100121 [Clonorchis sinensis]|uniref:Uncharacterized protein n=1 Tax=Clonorchis sinensis TaxID=79923 RepID=G7Y2Q4_CLOSI|nr:hypothetical protein CLF_100121 [Clonorchis sinensis]